MDKNNIEDILALTPMQEGMLFHYLKGPGKDYYFEQLCLEISGKIDLPLLEQAWNRVIERNDMLRTLFRWEKMKAPSQIVLKRFYLQPTYFDLSNQQGPQKETILEEIKKNDLKETFDLTGVPFRVVLCKMDADRLVMIISSHHILYDGWSNGIILKEFFNVYKTLWGGDEFLPLPPPPGTKFKDYVQWISQQDKDRQEKYWRIYLKGIERGTQFPVNTKKQEQPVSLQKAESYQVILPTGLNKRLDLFTRKYRVTTASVLFSAWGVLLQKYVNNDDVLFGTTVSGRSAGLKDIERIVGLFINTLPLRVTTQYSETVFSLICRIKEALHTREVYESTSLVDIKKYSEVPDKEELFNTIVVIENYPLDMRLMKEENNSLLTLQSFSIVGNTSYDLAIGILRGDDTEITFSYQSEFISGDTIKRLWIHFVRVIEVLITDPKKKAIQIDMLGHDEKKQLLYDFNDTTVTYPGNKVIHELFEEQVERTPDGTAVIFSGIGLTYRELNRSANQLAFQLRGESVKAGGIVGIFLGPSIERVAAMMAILKAGAAYLPLDPGLPPPRLASMLEDSQAPILLTNTRTMGKRSFTLLKNPGPVKLAPRVTGIRPQLTQLDDLPILDRSLVNYDGYMDKIGQAWVKHSLAIFATRGCPYKCAYCHKIWPKKHVVRSAENIFAEVKLYYDMGVRRFVIIDDIFNMNINNSRKFFQLILENKLKVQLFFPNGLRGDLLTQDYIDLMVEAGTISLALALETASPRLQKLVGKNLRLEKFRENLQYLCETYPRVITELFTMIGFPTETEHEAKMTLDFVKGIKGIHFPYINIVRIYANTDMYSLALANGVPAKAIFNSENLYFHELPETLPFSKSFALQLQTDFLNEYFLSKERLLHVLPYQVKVLTEEELVGKYNSYLAADMKHFVDLLQITGIREDELTAKVKGEGYGFLDEAEVKAPGLNEKIRAHFPVKKPGKDALRVLLLDLSQFFSKETDRLDIVFDPPLGVIAVISYMNQRFGPRVNGRVAKSRVDFDDFPGLRSLLKEFRPDIIGLRTLTYYRDFFHQTAALIRQWGFDVPLVTGGPYATGNFDTILQDKNIDLVIIGEGEATFSELIEKMLENEKQLPGEDVLKEIPGLAFIPGRPGRWTGKDRIRRKTGAYSREIIMVDEIKERLERNPGENLPPVNVPHDPAYIMFTSGSAGKPKGVIIEHKNVINNLHWFGKTFAIGPGTRLLQMSDYTFDPSVEDIFGSLVNGAALYLSDSRLIFDRERCRRFIKNNQIHIIDYIPFMLDELLGVGERLESLRVVISGGMRLEEAIKDRLITKGYHLYNHYGPTEVTVDALFGLCSEKAVTLGKPIFNTRCYIFDRYNHLVPMGVAGELCVAGEGVSRGYLNNPELTSEKFINYKLQITNKNVLGDDIHRSYRSYKSYIIYKTGDLTRWMADGDIEFLGRMDTQVKIRGFRIELEEIENCLRHHDGIKDALVVAVDDNKGDKYISAYIIPALESGTPGKGPGVDELKEYLSRILPSYMVPLFFVPVKEIPLAASGKVDRGALLSIGTGDTAPGTVLEYAAPGDDIEERIASTWKELLGLDKVGIHDNFFDMGGNSLLIIRLSSRLSKAFQRNIPVVMLFNYPTIALLARYLKGQEKDKPGIQKTRSAPGEKNKNQGFEIAVIGMSGRFPGAGNIEEFWDNLKNGVESITFFTKEELGEHDVDPELLHNPDNVYVPAKGVLASMEYFDSLFFGYIPAEAKMMDPQMRIFHECCWEAVEDAGYDTGTYDGIIGLYAGGSASLFWEVQPFLSGGDSESSWHSASQKWDALQYSDRDFLATRIAYRLNLKGPCVTVLSACSTSLVAIDLACRELLSGACDIALAGGASVTFEDEAGYLYMEGMIMSMDGHSRAFDAKASGIVGGDGVGVVVLKSLAEAAADGDHIRAVIKGSAVNNDGIQKAGFTAPGIDGQTRVIRAAHQTAGIEPESITYIESHGTGTPLGDPIEIEALKQAFGFNKTHVCAVGSVKTNIGHLDAAAGVAGFIKTVLALEHRLIPPSLHFETPNPKIQLDNSPFYINTTLKEWKSHVYPLRAGVSSYGVGGTNAHVVLEEWRGAQSAERTAQPREYHLILLSARTPSALDQMTENLAKYFKKNLLNRNNPGNSNHPGPGLADVAYTLQVGRKAFNHRRMMVCSNVDEAVETLSSLDSGSLQTFFSEPGTRPIVFMFPGQGSQYVNMGLGLYREEPLFRREMDRCFKILRPLMNCDLKEILYPDKKENNQKFYGGSRGAVFQKSPPGRRRQDINQTEIAQPLIFTIEYALARVLMHWGIEPEAMIGHSIGEYTAACLSGVFSLEDALKLVVLRGRLMQKLPPGAMLSVSLSEEELASLLIKELSLAAVNGPSACVVSGEKSAIARFSRELTTKGHQCKVLYTSHAFHSGMMDPILKEFRDQVRKVRLNSVMQIPLISNLTGQWLSLKDAADPGYWARHLRQTVRFGEGLNTLFEKENAIFLEVGPGQVLSTFVRQGANKKPGQFSINLVRQPKTEVCDHYYLINNIGRLWLYGVNINWKAFHPVEKRYRVLLPSYPFERRHYPVPKGLSKLKTGSGKRVGKNPDMADWFYIPYWEYSPEPPGSEGETGELSNYLIFMDECGLGLQMEKCLRNRGHWVTTVRKGEINPGNITDYNALLDELRQQDRLPQTIIHLWGVDDGEEKGSEIQVVEKNLEQGFYSLLYLAQALIKQNLSYDIFLEVVTTNMHEVTGAEALFPGKVMILGLNKVIPQEYPHINCRSIDIVLPGTGRQREQLTDQLLLEFSAVSSNPVIAYRNSYRWEQHFKPLRLAEALEGQSGLREEGVYLVTGGLGNIGLVLAEHMAKSVKAKLILTGRSAFPARSEWEGWLQSHGSKNRISRKIEKLLEMEKAGARVLVCQADVSHPQRMQKAIARAEKSFGRIDGVIHAAGLLGETMFRSVKDLDKTWCREQFQPKVYGVLALEEILKDRDLDFCLLMSSTSAILGGLGFAAYSAANLFMDGWTHKHNRTHPISWISVNWDGWRFGEEKKSADRLGESVEELSMTPAEGARAFQRILSVGKGRGYAGRIIQSAGDLQTRIDRWILGESPDKGEDFEDERWAVQEARPPLPYPYVAPGTREEQLVADTWGKLFGYAQLGILDNFFELGGDSLKATTVVSKIHKVLNVQIPLNYFFSNPTIKALAQYIGNTKASMFSPIVPVEKKEYYPLSSAQKRMFILQQVYRESRGYNMTFAIAMGGDIEEKKVGDISRKLIKRHASLRTSFFLLKGQPFQGVHDEVEFEVEYYDASQVEAKVEELEGTEGLAPLPKEPAAALISSFIRPFDLSRAPLLRVGLIKTEEKGCLLLLDTHHIASDGVSQVILMQDLMALYVGESLTGLQIQYKDFSEWQNRIFRTGQGAIKAQEQHWLKEFGGQITGLNLPLDYPRPKIKRFEGDSLEFVIEKELTDQLQELSNKTGTTLNMVLLAVYNILLFKYTRQEDIIVGMPAAGRKYEELQNIVGMFVNMLPIRNQPRGNKPFRSFLMEVKKNVLAALENQDYQFEELVKNLGLERDVSQNPLINVVFEMVNYDSDTLTEKLTQDKLNLEIELNESVHRGAVFDLILMGGERGDGVEMELVYATALFKSSTIEKMTRRYITILRQVAANDEIKLEDIELSHELRTVKSNIFEGKSEFGF